MRLQLVAKDEQLTAKDEQLVTQQKQVAEQDKKIKILFFRPTKEKTYQAHIHSMIGGQREFYMAGPYPGYVDVLTDHMVIEVKRVQNVGNACGQLLHYRAKLKGTEHEDKAYVVYLFGKVTAEEREVLETMADLANFQLMLHKEIRDFVDADELNKANVFDITVDKDLGPADHNE